MVFRPYFSLSCVKFVVMNGDDIINSYKYGVKR